MHAAIPPRAATLTENSVRKSRRACRSGTALLLSFAVPGPFAFRPLSQSPPRRRRRRRLSRRLLADSGRRRRAVS